MSLFNTKRKTEQNPEVPSRTNEVTELYQVKDKLYHAYNDIDEFGVLLRLHGELTIHEVETIVRRFCVTEIGVVPIIWDTKERPEPPATGAYLAVVIVHPDVLVNLDMRTFLENFKGVNILNDRPKVFFLIPDDDVLEAKANMFATGLKQLSKRRDNYTQGFSTQQVRYERTSGESKRKNRVERSTPDETE